MEGLSLLAACLHDIGQAIVLGIDLVQISLGQLVAAAVLSRNRLNRQAVKALVCNMYDILCKVQVLAGEGTTCVVVQLGITLLDQLLELGHDDIVAAGARNGLAHLVVDRRTAIERQNYVIHVGVDVVDFLVVEQQAVGGDGEAELLAVLVLDRTRIINGLLDRIPCHERLAAEEVNLDVAALARA